MRLEGVGRNEVRTRGMFKIAPSLRRNFELRVLKKTRVYIAIFNFDVKSRFQSFHKIEISENFENQGRLSPQKRTCNFRWISIYLLWLNLKF